jgi:hypothetical protein
MAPWLPFKHNGSQNDPSARKSLTGAYLELEREGVIVTQQGRGSRVAPDPDPGLRIDLEVPAGEIMGLIGPNGAGSVRTSHVC